MRMVMERAGLLTVVGVEEQNDDTEGDCVTQAE